MNSDIDLHKNVLDELAFDPSVEERHIGVAVCDGVVTLTGTVTHYSQKLAAEKAIKRVRGVLGIVEELLIDLPAYHHRNDADLVAAALDALRWNVGVPEGSVLVTVEDGWLTLSGTVDWQYQREAARLAVASLAGVCGVSNFMLLGKRVVASDVQAKIHESFRRHADLHADRIAVEASEGTVTLRGTVRSWTEHEDAVTAAYSIPGVTRVKNLTTVENLTTENLTIVR